MGDITPEQVGEIIPESAGGLSPEWWAQSLRNHQITALRRLALKGTELQEATAGTIRLKLLKLGALVTVSVRRIKIAIASASPLKTVFAMAHTRLCQAAA